MLKKVLSFVLSCVMLLSMTAMAGAESSGEKTLYYPSYLQESEGETLVLPKMPERIVCLSNAALQILVRCDIHPVAVTTPSSSVFLSICLALRMTDSGIPLSFATSIP